MLTRFKQPADRQSCSPYRVLASDFKASRAVFAAAEGSASDFLACSGDPKQNLLELIASTSCYDLPLLAASIDGYKLCQRHDISTGLHDNTSSKPDTRAPLDKFAESCTRG